MLTKASHSAIMVLALSAVAAQAQSLAQLGGPANLPPSSFAGQQFVDDRGCLFMRAGFGGAVNWVPRVDRNHQPLCGYPPTFAAATLTAVETAMAPDPEAVAPARVTSQVQPAEPAAAKAKGGFWAALFGTPTAPAVRPSASVAPAQPAAPALRLTSVPKPPKGYKLAWTDDRLNPSRGIGTSEGQAQQDLIWTRDVPARPVEAKPVRATGQVTVSTMSAPETEPQTGAVQAFVQVGSFGDPANALGAQNRLRALGLPVATSQITRNGRVLTVVYAGPFLGQDAARAGLSTARGAGFEDAILRMN